MNNASLHVCISIIQTNHYICSIIFIMNYSPARGARWKPNRLGCEYKRPVVEFGDFMYFWPVIGLQVNRCELICCVKIKPTH